MSRNFQRCTLQSASFSSLEKMSEGWEMIGEATNGSRPKGDYSALPLSLLKIREESDYEK